MPPAPTPQPSGNDIPTIHTTARLVVLDVVVTDNSGKPVKGLKPSDFTLTEDGVAENLASFTEHDEATDRPPNGITPAANRCPPTAFTVRRRRSASLKSRPSSSWTISTIPTTPMSAPTS